MSDTQSIGLLRPGERNQWVRLRTLTHLRWVAIVGQSAAIFVSVFVLNLDLPLVFCLAAVALASIANLVAIFIYPENKRLSENEAMLFLLFDAAQLACLLGLTGGLNNPFCLLILTPVTISATALSLRPTVKLGLFTALAVSLLNFFSIPLMSIDGSTQTLPEIFRFGFWIAMIIGIVFLAFYASRVMSEINSMSDALLATQMALAREQKLTDLGGVVAAAAHEMGTPLATIKLTSSELVEDLSDRPDLQDDARLIREQTDRCRDILRSMGRAGKDDKTLHNVLLANIISEAAEPHVNRGKELIFNMSEGPLSVAAEPRIQRRPEIVHGLRNLIQNAVDFSEHRVRIDASWTDQSIRVRISDDGLGFAPHVLSRIGDPFMHGRGGEDRKRPGYDGMGMGLFIAKTLLERTGAELSFANGLKGSSTSGGRGAIVQVDWPRALIAVPDGEPSVAIGENPKF